MAAEAVKVPAVIEGKFNLALTQSGFQKLADKEGKLVYNEDNIEEIKQFLIQVRGVEKEIEKTHEEGKRPSLTEGKQWDLAKNTFLGTVAPVRERAHTKYTKLCQDIDERKRKQALETQRIDGIKDAIDKAVVQYAKEIADCTSTAGLTSIESRINLEKTRSSKYQEFLPKAVERLTELNTVLKTQKDAVRQLENLAEQKKIAEQAGDDEKLLQIAESEEIVTNSIEETKTIAQETAINQGTKADEIETVKEVIPDMSARRTTWKYEMVNKDLVMKKNPELLIVSLDKEKVDNVLKTLKDTKQLVGKQEFVLNGIRFFEQKTF